MYCYKKTNVLEIGIYLVSNVINMSLCVNKEFSETDTTQANCA